MKEAYRAMSRDSWQALLAAAAFGAAYFGARLLLKVPELGAVPRFAAAFLPALAFLWFVWAEVRMLRGADELERRIQLEALAIAWPLAVAIVMTISLLQKAALLTWEPMWLYLPITYFIGLALARRRYQ